MEIRLTGHERRKVRALRLYKEWYKLLSDPKKPMTVKEIVAKYRKPDGSKYTEQAVYKGLRTLEQYENNNGVLPL